MSVFYINLVPFQHGAEAIKLAPIAAVMLFCCADFEALQ